MTEKLLTGTLNLNTTNQPILNTEIFFVTLFSGTLRLRRLKLATHVNSGQMYHVYRNWAAAAYSSLYFFIFLSLQFSPLKFFITHFLATVRPRRLTLGTHVDSGQMYHVYRNQAAAAYSSLYSFFFLSNFQHWNFSSLFSQELWGLEDWNLVHTWTVGRCIVCTRMRLLLLICTFISSFFFLSNYQTLKIFVTFFSGTVRSRRLKLGIHVDSGWMYRVCQNQAAAYSPLYFFFLSNIQTLKIFVTLFWRTVRPRRLKLGAHMDNGWIVYTGTGWLLHICPFVVVFFIFFFSPIFKH